MSSPSISRVASMKVDDPKNSPIRYSDIYGYLSDVLEYGEKDNFYLADRIKNKIHQFRTEGVPTGSYTRTGTWMIYLTEDEFETLSNAKMMEGVTFSEWKNSIRDPRDDENGDLYVPIPSGDTERRTRVFDRVGKTLRKLKNMGLIAKYDQRSSPAGVITHYKVNFDRSCDVEQKKLVYLYISSTYLSSTHEYTSKDGKTGTRDVVDGTLECRWWRIPKKE